VMTVVSGTAERERGKKKLRAGCREERESEDGRPG
jgi:hypothetical protein